MYGVNFAVFMMFDGYESPRAEILDHSPTSGRDVSMSMEGLSKEYPTDKSEMNLKMPDQARHGHLPGVLFVLHHCPGRP